MESSDFHTAGFLFKKRKVSLVRKCSCGASWMYLDEFRWKQLKVESVLINVIFFFFRKTFLNTHKVPHTIHSFYFDIVGK